MARRAGRSHRLCFSLPLLVFFLSVEPLALSAAAHSQTLIRVDVGSTSPYTDTAGNEWAADNHVARHSGTAVNWGAIAINGTNDPALYRTGRWDTDLNPEMQFSFTVPNGAYGVKLHFSENNVSSSVGTRKFTVLMEDQAVISDLDIFARVGARTALIMTSAVTVTDGELNIHFRHGVESPIISAIEIIEGIPRHEVFEASLTTGNKLTNPFSDALATATFTSPSGRKLLARGFYDGQNTWRARIAPDEVGTWSYSIALRGAAGGSVKKKTGTFDCIASTDRGFIRPDSERPYWFSYSDGTPFYGVGDTSYGLVSGLTDEQRTGYFAERAAQNFNFIRFFVTDGFRHRQLLNTHAWAWGGTPSDPDYDQLNPRYFQRLELILRELKSRGMHAEIEVFNYYAPPFTNPRVWTQARQDLWARYVVSRLSAYSTVFLWTVTNEYEAYPDGVYRYDDPTDDKWGDSMAALFHEMDPHKHPTTVHNWSFDPGGGIGTRFGESPNVDVLTQQEWGDATWNGAHREGDAAGIEQQIAKDRVYEKPVINTENGYEWLPDYFTFNQQVASSEKARRAAWRVFVGGGATYAAGFAGTWPGKDNFIWDSEGPLFFKLRDSGLGRYVKHFASFVKTTDFRNMAPAQNLVAAPNSCLAHEGHEYVVYAPSGGVVALDLSGASGNFSAKWFDPRTGLYRDEPSVAGGQTHTFTSPDADDWILHVKGI